MITREIIEELAKQLPEGAELPGRCTSWSDAVQLFYLAGKPTAILWYNDAHGSTKAIRHYIGGHDVCEPN